MSGSEKLEKSRFSRWEENFGMISSSVKNTDMSHSFCHGKSQNSQSLLRHFESFYISGKFIVNFYVHVKNSFLTNDFIRSEN